MIGPTLFIASLALGSAIDLDWETYGYQHNFNKYDFIFGREVKFFRPANTGTLKVKGYAKLRQRFVDADRKNLVPGYEEGDIVVVDNINRDDVRIHYYRVINDGIQRYATTVGKEHLVPMTIHDKTATIYNLPMTIHDKHKYCLKEILPENTARRPGLYAVHQKCIMLHPGDVTFEIGRDVVQVKGLTGSQSSINGQQGTIRSFTWYYSGSTGTKDSPVKWMVQLHNDVAGVQDHILVETKCLEKVGELVGGKVVLGSDKPGSRRKSQ